MEHEMKKTGYFLTCGTGPAVGMELGVGQPQPQPATQDKTSVVVGSKIRFGSSGGDPKWPRLHPKGQQDTNKEENDFIHLLY
jgi:hypothetical protein